MKKIHLLNFILFLFVFTACGNDDFISGDDEQETYNDSYTLENITYSNFEVSFKKEEYQPVIVINNSDAPFYSFRPYVMDVMEVSCFTFDSPVLDQKLSEIEISTPQLFVNKDNDVSGYYYTFLNEGWYFQHGEQTRMREYTSGKYSVNVAPNSGTRVDYSLEYPYIKSEFTALIRNKRTGEISTIKGKWEGTPGGARFCWMQWSETDLEGNIVLNGKSESLSGEIPL